MKYWKIMFFWIFLTTPLINISHASKEKPPARPPLEIKKIIVAEEIIRTNQTQLIEITLRNNTSRITDVICRLSIKFPSGQSKLYGKRRIRLLPFTDTKCLIPYKVRIRKGRGVYEVSPRIFHPKGRRLLLNSRSVAKFVVPGKNTNPKEMTGEVVFTAPEEFEEIDLVIKKNWITLPQVLRGEKTSVRITVGNDGGDIARNVEVQLQWYLKKRPGKKFNIPVSQFPIPYLAPGEQKIFEIPFLIPPNNIQGLYKVIARIDPLKKENESRKDNNELVSENEINFQDISLRHPNEKHSFAENGIFLFQWKSKKYNQFKVQISSDIRFLDTDRLIQLPFDQFTSKQEISSEIGENIMAQGFGSDGLVYWRIVATNSKNEEGLSEIRSFYINKKPALPESI